MSPPQRPGSRVAPMGLTDQRRTVSGAVVPSFGTSVAGPSYLLSMLCLSGGWKGRRSQAQNATLPRGPDIVVAWIGLSATDARRGIAASRNGLASVSVYGVERYLDPALLDTAPTTIDGGEVLVLPGLDEYPPGYKDRSLSLPDEHKPAITPGNRRC
jgi:hypothetical protein